MTLESPSRLALKHPIHLAICAGLVLLFGILSLTAILTKSATYDEPMHALGGWIHRHEGDFRINFEDPPLWQYWATIPTGSGAIKLDKSNPHWALMPQNVYEEWGLTLDTLYRTPGNDGIGFLNRMRTMMVLLGVGLCIVVIVWTWQLAGPTAAVIAAALVCLDPNLIGHSALVKNDAPMALMMTAVFLATWKVGQKLTWANAIALCLLVAASVNVKFSALLFGPMLLILLAIRVLLPKPWVVFKKELKGIAGKALTAAALVGSMAIISYIAIWACYGFRFGPSPDPTVQLNTDQLKLETVKFRYQADHPPMKLEPFNPGLPLPQLVDRQGRLIEAMAAVINQLRVALPRADFTEATRNQMVQTIESTSQYVTQSRQLHANAQAFIAANSTPVASRPADFAQQIVQVAYNVHSNSDAMNDAIYTLQTFTYWASVGDRAPDGFIALLNIFIDNHLLPSAWLHGVLFVHARSIVRGSYLLGQVSSTGWWYYFPLAMLFKTSVASILALLGSAGVGGWLIYLRRKAWRDWAWPVACLAVPFGIYMLSVMTANLNIGLRHVLCVYPAMYVAAGAILVRAMTWRPWIVKAHLGALAALLAIETLAAWPNYIAYFNFASDVSLGKMKMLADSNFDWGQDLPALVKWQHENPDKPLALGYFGITEPVPNKGPDSTALPLAYGLKFVDLPPGPINPEIAKGYIIAVSATHLQGVYSQGWYNFNDYRQFTPLDVLNGTIYLYDLRGLK